MYQGEITNCPGSGRLAHCAKGRRGAFSTAPTVWARAVNNPTATGTAERSFADKEWLTVPVWEAHCFSLFMIEFLTSLLLLFMDRPQSGPLGFLANTTARGPLGGG